MLSSQALFSVVFVHLSGCCPLMWVHYRSHALEPFKTFPLSQVPLLFKEPLWPGEQSQHPPPARAARLHNPAAHCSARVINNLPSSPVVTLGHLGLLGKPHSKAPEPQLTHSCPKNVSVGWWLTEGLICQWLLPCTHEFSSQHPPHRTSWEPDWLYWMWQEITVPYNNCAFFSMVKTI